MNLTKINLFLNIYTNSLFYEASELAERGWRRQIRTGRPIRRANIRKTTSK